MIMIMKIVPLALESLLPLLEHEDIGVKTPGSLEARARGTDAIFSASASASASVSEN
jgi:hypothetical protein